MAEILASAADVASKIESVDNKEELVQSQVDEASENKKSVEELLSEGNAALALGKYAEASEHFSFAVEKLVEKHGEMSIEIVDALEAYGNSLLRNGIASSAVLGGEAATGKVSDAEKDSLSNEAGGTAPAEIPTPASTTATSSVIPAASSSKASAAPKEPLTAQNINFHFGGDAAEDEEDEDDEEDDGEGEGKVAEEVDDFETAWEILDTARAILVKADEGEGTEESKKERKLQLARVHSSMAEVATESGRPEDGVKEYETALSIQSALLPPWNRLVAQTHLFIALALELVPTSNFADADAQKQEVVEKSFIRAVEHVQAAQGILAARKKHLLGYSDEGSDAKGKGKAIEDVANLEPKKELSEKDKDEIKDIDELTVDLSEKIEDLKAQISEAQQTPTSLQDQLKEDASALPEGVSREVHNLNSMVKKKKKPASVPGPLPEAPQVDKPEINGTKRKAEDEISKTEANGATEGGEEKRAKLDGSV